MKKGIIFLLLLFSIQHTVAQRNVILLIADDLGTDYLGCYEDAQDTVDLPNIRTLVKRGVRFQNAHSNPVCSATRASILTGRYGFRTGVGGIVGGAGGSNQLPISEITIPQLLALYKPAIAKANIGKWHLHQPNPAANLMNPLTLGYDRYEGPFIGQLPSYTNWTKYTNGQASTVTHYATSENIDNAVSWLKTIDNKQFFLWIGFNAPHAPLHLPPANLHHYTNLSGTAPDIRNNPKSYFKAMLQSLDTEIGRLFDSLKVINKYDSTDFIFIGDNGNTAVTAQISDTSRAKGTVYQYGIHVPFIIAGPSVVQPGRASSQLVNVADIFATTLELMGDTAWRNNIPTNKPVDAKSILPILKNKNVAIRPWAFSENFKLIPDESDAKAIRNLDYKIIKFDNGKEEFYHLATDPGELNNLLTGNMNAEAITNYQYLCASLSSLLGSTAFCNASLSVNNNLSGVNEIAYPNPFIDFIQIDQSYLYCSIQLTNINGTVIYSGKEIDKQNFSAIPAGIYFLNSTTGIPFQLKLVKIK